MASSELLKWLGLAMVQARQRGGLEAIDIAARLRNKEGTVAYWEDGEHLPRNLDITLTAYAELGGLAGQRELCELALELWREHDEDAARRVAAQVRDAIRPPDEHPESSSEVQPDADASDAAS